MGFQEKLLDQAYKLARKSPEEIAQEIEKEETEKLERLKNLAEEAKEYLEELAANVLNRTMCDNCYDEFPDDEMNYVPNVRDGAPVCKECYEFLTN